ncbi:hypothetical protein COB64_00455 [Candidatus Wolfebacteria bacterium]|nr:MAG: hypothetical protein COB64_00455 [Candidatus Wolfebacteria bacterium]
MKSVVIVINSAALFLCLYYMRSKNNNVYFFLSLVVTALILFTQGVVFLGIKSAFAYGGGGGVFLDTFIAPTGGVTVVINDNEAVTSSREVTLTLNGGSTAKKMSISNTSEFQGIVQEVYATTKIWTLSESDGEKEVYVKFFNSQGTSSLVASDSIIYGTSVSISTCRDVDTNDDDSIDILDFNTLMVNWGNTDVDNVADFDCDSIVSILDFNLLMINWV